MASCLANAHRKISLTTMMKTQVIRVRISTLLLLARDLLYLRSHTLTVSQMNKAAIESNLLRVSRKVQNGVLVRKNQKSMEIEKGELRPTNIRKS